MAKEKVREAQRNEFRALTKLTTNSIMEISSPNNVLWRSFRCARLILLCRRQLGMSGSSFNGNPKACSDRRESTWPVRFLDDGIGRAMPLQAISKLA